MDITGMTFTGGWVMGPPCDPYYGNVSLLLPMNGANGSTTFTDYSPSPKTVTAFGNAQISTAQSVFGGGSVYFDGNGDYLSTPSNTAFDFGSGDFTIEAWIRPTGYAKTESGTNASSIISKDILNGRSWFFQLDGTPTSWSGLSFYGFSSSIPSIYQFVAGSATINNNQWYYVAVARSGTTVRLFLNGTLIATESSWTTTIQSVPTTPVKIGAQNWDPVYLREFTGYIDDLRVTKGVARYTANFTPPTQAFPTTSC